MSIIFYDGFDFYNRQGSPTGPPVFGWGGRKWDVDSIGTIYNGPGRFGGQCLEAQGSSFSGVFAWNGARKTFPSTSEVIFGGAVRIDSYVTLTSGNVHPFIIFYDDGTPQVSIWAHEPSHEIIVRTGRGTEVGYTDIATSLFVPPQTLWFYLEVRVLCHGSAGEVEIRVNGQTKVVETGVETDQSGNAQINQIGLCGIGVFGPNVLFDDVYFIDTTDATGAVDFLGEVRVQTKYPDADGFQTDFLPSTGTVNAQNANATPTYYTDASGLYNYSGVVGAIDLYSIGNFTVSGEIFAVQENLSFRKDDVGNRYIRPYMRTAATNYEGNSFPCYSEYTHASKIWEENPSTGDPWLLVDLNDVEFGIKVEA